VNAREGEPDLYLVTIFDQVPTPVEARLARRQQIRSSRKQRGKAWRAAPIVQPSAISRAMLLQEMIGQVDLVEGRRSAPLLFCYFGNCRTWSKADAAGLGGKPSLHLDRRATLSVISEMQRDAERGIAATGDLHEPSSCSHTAVLLAGNSLNLISPSPCTG
jgi:hypothetical protein